MFTEGQGRPVLMWRRPSVLYSQMVWPRAVSFGVIIPVCF